jgi:hypothetical protein
MGGAKRVSDTIDRQAAMNEVVAWLKDRLIDRKNGKLLTERLRDLPPAQPELPFEIQDILDYLDTALHPIISPEHWNVYSELHDMISTLSSAQPEIIRCKDCKYGNPNGMYGCKCYHYKRYEVHEMRPDDFCSYAERRTDEQTVSE